MHVQGFEPLAKPDARVLVLGTMPGKPSLRARQYYAHPRNAFWSIVGEVFGFDAKEPYDQRVEALLAHQISVWDVLQLCTRESSLDSDIEEASIVPNDFALFFRDHPLIQRICFNGATAAELFQRRVRPQLGVETQKIEYRRLPSSSPANAGTSYGEKLRAWKAGLL